MAEAFVKTIERDYVWLNDLSSAYKVLPQLSKCIAKRIEHIVA